MRGKPKAPHPRSALVPVHVRPVRDAPALSIPRRRGEEVNWLAIADLHLGLGANAERPRGPPGSQSHELAERILRLAEAEHAQGLIIAGDAKHPIVGVPAPLRSSLFDFFAALLSGGLRVELILGNHDVGIERHLPREVFVHPSSGVVVNGVGLFHGHRWPAPLVLSASRLVAGHLHPGVRFAPTAEEPTPKHRAWVRVDLTGAAVEDPAGKRVRARELIVLPAFNPLAGTEALNRERPGRGRTFLYRHFLLAGEARAYLLDGTDVGPIATSSNGRGPSTRKKARSGR